MVLFEYPMKSSSRSSRYWGSTLATMILTTTSMTASFVHHSLQSVSWSALRTIWSKLEVSFLKAELILSSFCRALTLTVPLVTVERADFLRTRARQPCWPPHAVVRTEAQFFHFFLEEVHIFCERIPGEGLDWFCHNDSVNRLIDGCGGGTVGHFSCSFCCWY